MAKAYSKKVDNGKDYLEVDDTDSRKQYFNFESLEAACKKWLDLMDQADIAGLEVGDWSKVVQNAKNNGLL